MKGRHLWGWLRWGVTVVCGDGHGGGHSNWIGFGEAP